MRARRAFLTIAFLVLAAPVWEHPAPFSYLDLQLGGSGVRGSLVAHAIDVAHELGLSSPDAILDPTVARANRERLLNVTIVEAPDHAKAVEMVEASEVDAFVMDDVLLYGLAANRPNPAALKVVGKFLTTEPLAIMLPKNDPEFKKLVDDEMRRLIVSKEIYPIYDKWFLKPIPPKNTPLNMPVSYLLKDFWKYPTDQVPF